MQRLEVSQAAKVNRVSHSSDLALYTFSTRGFAKSVHVFAIVTALTRSKPSPSWHPPTPPPLTVVTTDKICSTGSAPCLTALAGLGGSSCQADTAAVLLLHWWPLPNPVPVTLAKRCSCFPTTPCAAHYLSPKIAPGLISMNIAHQCHWCRGQRPSGSGTMPRFSYSWFYQPLH